MDLGQIKELIELLETNRLRKLVYKKGDLEIQLEAGGAPYERAAPPVEHHPVVKSGHREEGAFVTSPMVGTYYAAPAPGEPFFVKVGDSVTEETILCIIEAMKVMNEVKAGVRGVVAEILAENGQPVEFGTRLFRIT